MTTHPLTTISGEILTWNVFVTQSGSFLSYSITPYITRCDIPRYFHSPTLLSQSSTIQILVNSQGYYYWTRRLIGESLYKILSCDFSYQSYCCRYYWESHSLMLSQLSQLSHGREICPPTWNISHREMPVHAFSKKITSYFVTQHYRSYLCTHYCA